MAWVVRVVETETETVEREWTCSSENRAWRIHDGVMQNLNFDRFHIEIEGTDEDDEEKTDG